MLLFIERKKVVAVLIETGTMNLAGVVYLTGSNLIPLIVYLFAPGCLTIAKSDFRVLTPLVSLLVSSLVPYSSTSLHSNCP